MRAQGIKKIRSLERGLEVLQILQSARAAKLTDLHRVTRLPKATLLRILITLEAAGLIWQRIADGAYLPSYSLQERARFFDNIDRLVEIASPIMEELCERVGYPSVLAIPRLDYMEVIETNSPKSHMDHIRLGPVGFRVNLLRSSTGRAYLAFCGEPEREAVLAHLRGSKNPGDAKARDPKWVQRVLAETRALGYGTRTEDYGGHYEKSREEFDDGHNSIAVPILVYGNVLGCINLSWVSRTARPKAIAEQYLADLQGAAQAIAAGMTSGRVERPVTRAGEGAPEKPRTASAKAPAVTRP